MLHCTSKAALYHVDMTLGNRIKRARERLKPKPTQQDIADAFGISDKAVSQWERDETVPEHAKLAKLAELLHVSARWLLDGKGDPPPIDGLEALVETLSADERAAIIGVVSAMRKRPGRVA